MIFDSHAHYDDEKFNEDRDTILSTMTEHGIETIVNVGSNLETSKKSIELARKYPFIYAAIGVHPSDVDCLDEKGFSWLGQQADLEKVVAIGEIGLDYYWEKDKGQQEKQKLWFKRQLQLAREKSLPVIIHSRDAAEDTLTLMKEANAQEIPGVIHCFSYSLELAQEYIKMGYYIGIGGVLTFKNARKLKEVAATIPLERILLETDCPYLAPEPNRGKRNSSWNLPYVVAELSALRNISEEEVIEETTKNAQKFYLNHTR